MIRIHLVAADGGQTTLEVKPRGSHMEAAVKNDVDRIDADGGGLMTCATCHVYVREPFAAKLPAASADELGMLGFTAAERRANSRLSCQIALSEELDGLIVDLPDAQH